MTLDAAKVSGLKIRYEADGEDLFSGFINGSMELSYHGEAVFPPNGDISVTARGSGFYITAEGYRISSIRRHGKRVSIRGRDNMRELERPVDVSLYDRDSRVESSLAVGAIAAASGFSGAANVPSVTLCYDDLADKTAREVLRALSVIGCGVWYRTAENVLAFAPYGNAGSTVECTTGAVFHEHSKKGAISCVKAHSTETRKDYSRGSGDYTRTVRIRGRMITGAVASAVLGHLAGKYIRSFYVSRLPCTSMVPGSLCITRDNVGYFPLKTEIVFCSAPFINAEYPDICEDEFMYTDKREYDTREKLSPMTVYGSTVITEKGVGILEKGDSEDIRSRAAQYFSEAKGAVTRFSGAVMDSKMPLSITDLSPTRKRIAYDSVSYILSFTKTASGKTDISLTEEEEE